MIGQSAQDGQTGSPYRYAGMRYDEIGLYVTPNRTYVPGIGRWLQMDPAGTADGLNRYAYVGNNPLSGYDPLGLADENTQDKIQKNTCSLVGGSSCSGSYAHDQSNSSVSGSTSSSQSPNSGSQGGGRGPEKLSPDPNAEGPHSSFRRDADTGEIDNYETYEKNPYTDKYVPEKRYRGNGKPHGGVEPPLVLEREEGKGPGAPVKVPRSANPSEIPGRAGSPIVPPVLPRIPLPGFPLIMILPLPPNPFLPHLDPGASA
ncbi:RHS repeat-associated protein [Nitrospirillum amazonense]|uniref:RHS repeat-associated protein n=1 Tax=Nitrospirillum amazonense TaxID=28077 RepID=A0A560EG43_9PROT|nr:RHS repeat-associated protein [Nitrospirillum amazonense]